RPVGAVGAAVPDSRPPHVLRRAAGDRPATRRRRVRGHRAPAAARAADARPAPGPPGWAATGRSRPTGRPGIAGRRMGQTRAGRPPRRGPDPTGPPGRGGAALPVHPAVLTDSHTGRYVRVATWVTPCCDDGTYPAK